MSFIKTAVNNLVEQYGTRDPFELADHLGITIIRFPFKKIKGLAISLFGHKIIGLNSRLPEQFQRVIVAHEIGHNQLHPQGMGYFFMIKETFFVNGKYERQAHQFAAELLLAADKPAYGESIEDYAKRKEVPVELLRIWVKESQSFNFRMEVE
ncbi:MAG: ImmA/IrrE family metallo-endopeptidase [Thermoanaerobacteraceae bacterium]|nr:ImmA/IrrE family metallo-endopeptidase [Thermoanaerobacteraceae bacterium]